MTSFNVYCHRKNIIFLDNKNLKRNRELSHGMPSIYLSLKVNISNFIIKNVQNSLYKTKRDATKTTKSVD